MINEHLDRWPFTVLPNCQICGGEELSPFYVVEQKDFSYLMNICRHCGHVQVGRTQYPPETKAECCDYYNSFGANDEEIWETIDDNWRGRLRAFRNILSTIRKLGFPKGRLLDVGSACGHMLNLAREAGYQVIGVEPSPSARRLAKERFGIDSVEHIDMIPPEEQPFDVILCLETIYYCCDAKKLLRKMSEKLSYDGCLVIKIRSNRTNLFRLFSYLSRLRGRLLYVRPGSLLHKYSLIGYHLFTTRNISRFLGSAGLKVVKTANEKQDLTPSLSILYVLKLTRAVLSCCISFFTMGRVKVGTEITKYAIRNTVDRNVVPPTIV